MDTSLDRLIIASAIRADIRSQGLLDDYCNVVGRIEGKQPSEIKARVDSLARKHSLQMKEEVLRILEEFPE
jgi:hypothetical protein